MSSIGSGLGATGAIEPTKPAGAVQPARSVSAQPAAVAAPAVAKPTTTAATASAVPEVRTTAPGAGEIPIDGNRVAQIKRAIETGSYPVLPVRISDAMIAAGLLLQKSK
jgi:negative regulator of flagellin synthesis FlgM